MNVFVYGTLADPDRAGSVLEEFSYRGPAVLEGLHRVDGEYPTLAPGESVMGRLLSTDDVAALDRYEGVRNGLYVRISVPIVAGGADGPDDATDTAEVYVGDPDRLDADVDVEWPGDGSFAERVLRYAGDNELQVRSRRGTFDS